MKSAARFLPLIALVAISVLVAACDQAKSLLGTVTAAPTAPAVATEAEVLAQFNDWSPVLQPLLSQAEGLALQFGVKATAERVTIANQVGALAGTLRSFEGRTGANGAPPSIASIVSELEANYPGSDTLDLVSEGIGAALSLVQAWIPYVTLYLPVWNGVLEFAATTLDDGVAAYLTPAS